MQNQVIRILSGHLEGLYRMILVEGRIDLAVMAKLSCTRSREGSRRGRKKSTVPKSPRKKAPLPLVGGLIWVRYRELESLDAEHMLTRVEIEPEKNYFNPIIGNSDKERYENRKKVMAGFLDYDNLRDSILASEGLGSLVKEAIEKSGSSRAMVYKFWSLLCRFGISEASLRPRSARCGAPGIRRPCDPGGRKKAGRKTTKQRIAKVCGISLPPEQPGISTVWRQLIMAADQKIPTPKPDHPARYVQILNSHFVRRYRVENGELIPLELKKGEYPNSSQVRRVLAVEVPRLQRLLERTTKGHFLRSFRGITAHNWKGVAGPGHTWAIDSTIGDIYLRSSVNRAWVIGRPVVYIIVDIWSTAVVGFYVCLIGPSWDMAKISLFSAAAPPDLIASLWQCQPMECLSPVPTMPAALMCDRGEYLSRAASVTGFKLIPCMSYAPPYRPDLKGLVEVLHRIKKDRQYLWIPGAIDARREEYELRRFNPQDAVLTVREYVCCLSVIFNEYNLTAKRNDRVDTHMAAAGVFPSPAGLWRWGHEMGIGTRRTFPQSELITSLLPSESAIVSRAGIRFSGLHYESDQVNEEQWTAHVRNFGSWNIPANYFPGSVSRIWTPNVAGTGLLDLQLSEQTRASRDQTFDEVLDAFMFGKLNRAEVEHANVLLAIKSRQKMESLIASARALTDEALERQRGAVPSITESRQLESKVEGQLPSEPKEPKPPSIDEAQEAYVDMMKNVFAAANTTGD
ncbi:putative tn7-like transposition protein B [Collimonas fungivorans]|uniref:Putative tn7-like transposition protein B n=2 Tax=Collimonas fungivorans TaxID=158899 RepID=A0A127P6A2_9BURK|nr:putative tn7-like transposition protein B [Collimonas fungivorans]